MDEKIIIKSEHFNIKKICIISLIVGVMLIIGLFPVNAFINSVDRYANSSMHTCDLGWAWDNSAIHEIHPTLTSFIECYVGLTPIQIVLLSFVFIAIYIAIIFAIFSMYSKYELVVTEKRIYGKTKFGKAFDIPLDSVSAIQTKFMKSIAIVGKNGTIKIKFIKNYLDVHIAINKLLAEGNK